MKRLLSLSNRVLIEKFQIQDRSFIASLDIFLFDRDIPISKKQRKEREQQQQEKSPYAYVFVNWCN